MTTAATSGKPLPFPAQTTEHATLIPPYTMAVIHCHRVEEDAVNESCSLVYAANGSGLPDVAAVDELATFSALHISPVAVAVRLPVVE